MQKTSEVRIARETKLMLECTDPLMSFTVDPNCYRHFFVNLKGADGTLFYGGHF